MTTPVYRVLRWCLRSFLRLWWHCAHIIRAALALAPTAMSMALQSLAQLITSADAAAVDAADAAADATAVDAADAAAVATADAATNQPSDGSAVAATITATDDATDATVVNVTDTAADATAVAADNQSSGGTAVAATIAATSDAADATAVDAQSMIRLLLEALAPYCPVVELDHASSPSQ